MDTTPAMNRPIPMIRVLFILCYRLDDYLKNAASLTNRTLLKKLRIRCLTHLASYESLNLQIFCLIERIVILLLLIPLILYPRRVKLVLYFRLPVSLSPTKFPLIHVITTSGFQEPQMSKEQYLLPLRKSHGRNLVFPSVRFRES